MGAINGLEENINDVDFIIIDKFSSDDAIKKYYKKLGTSNFNLKEFHSPLKLIEKAEMEHVSVAAASIMARSFFIELMKKQNKKWNTNFPLGTSQIVEDFITDFVKKHGTEVLPEIAKLSFKTTKKLFGNN